MSVRLGRLTRVVVASSVRALARVFVIEAQTQVDRHDELNTTQQKPSLHQSIHVGDEGTASTCANTTLTQDLAPLELDNRHLWQRHLTMVPVRAVGERRDLDGDATNRVRWLKPVFGRAPQARRGGNVSLFVKARSNKDRIA